MSDHQAALQDAVKAKLEAASIATVYDFVPARAEFPFLAIGDDVVVEAGTKTNEAQEITITIYALSRGRGRRAVKALAGQVYDTLHRQPLTVAGANVVLLVNEGSNIIQDDDGLTYRGVLRYRALIDD